MSINATIDGVVYAGIDTITTGGKIVSLAETGADVPVGVTILNGQPATILTGTWEGVDYGYKNVVPLWLPSASVAKVEARFKEVTSGTTGNIWLTCGAAHDAGGSNGYISTGSTNVWQGATITTNDVENDIRHIIVESMAQTGLFVNLCGFGTNGWSGTMAFYEFKAWDSNDTLLCDLKPAKINSINRVGFWDNVRNLFVSSAQNGNDRIIAGLPQS